MRQPSEPDSWEFKGLVNNEGNANKIRRQIETSYVPLTPQVVDDAVGRLRSVLEWKPPQQPHPQPTPPPAQQPVRRLSNGEPELSLNVSVGEMRTASTQLQDLSRRRGEGRSKPLGTFSSKF